MTRDDIIRMAREAGYLPDMFGVGIWDSNEFNRFAALVAEAEREACAEICDNWELGRDDICLVADEIRARGEG